MLSDWLAFLIYDCRLKAILSHSESNQGLTVNALFLKDLAKNMGQGDENLDQDVILKFIQVIKRLSL